MMQYLLRTENLTKQYGTFCMGPVRLEILKGCIVGLIGENGAGKSTFIKSILGLVHAAGQVSLLPDTPAGRDVRQDLGVVLGTPMIPNQLKVKKLEKIMAATYDRWDSALFQSYCQQFSIEKNSRFRTLSAGTKMKLGLAVALSHHPQFLILDEPAAGLDPVARDELNDILFEFTREEDHGVLISSHILSDLERVCDYIAFIHKGKLLFMEEKDRLLERYGICRCSEEERKQLPETAVVGLRHTTYGEEVLIDKTQASQIETGHTTIEDIMVLMVKGGQP